MGNNRHNTRHNSRRSNNHHNSRHSSQHSSDYHYNTCSWILDLSVCYSETCMRSLFWYVWFSLDFCVDMRAACKERGTCS